MQYWLLDMELQKMDNLSGLLKILGEKNVRGYFFLHKNAHNQCGVATDAAFPLVAGQNSRDFFLRFMLDDDIHHLRFAKVSQNGVVSI